MYILVVGGGRLGYNLLKALLNEGHEVLLLEKDARICKAITDEMGSICFRGDGCEAATLAEVGTGRADMLVAVTGDDEDNLVSCQVAKHKHNVPRTVARIRNPRNAKLFKKTRLGFSGTFNAHPVSMAAGLAVMEEMKPPVYDAMDRLGERMREGTKAILEEAGVDAFVGGIGSFFHVVWTPEEVKDYRTAATGDRVLGRYFSLDMMNRGVYLLGHPNVSAVTTDEDLDFALSAIRRSVGELRPHIEERAPHLLA